MIYILLYYIKVSYIQNHHIFYFASEHSACPYRNLFHKDLQIFYRIMTKYRGGCFGFGVHADVIIYQRHEQRLRQVMMEEYKKIMGFYPVID
jgi:hypothetical protein